MMSQASIYRGELKREEFTEGSILLIVDHLCMKRIEGLKRSGGGTIDQGDKGQLDIRPLSHLLFNMRLELIVELEKLKGGILAYHCVNLMRDVNDADLSKARSFMTAISQTQTKVLKKISFVVQMWGK
ncbi:hypothetical protein Tco_0628527 [Tanacetum coccineum]|uniref:Uncharacterized protein n=1 Tax=Tanacetum coccineum TaxID=301880 RepID=A0ABQ4WQK0_9ASTR